MQIRHAPVVRQLTAGQVVDAVLLLGFTVAVGLTLPASTAQRLLLCACGVAMLAGRTLLGGAAQSLLDRADDRREALLDAITALKQRDGSQGCARAELMHRATHDSLTGLPNRALFERRLNAAIQDGRPFVVVVLDVDRFRNVNEALGHGAGDATLTLVARRLLSSTRAEDAVARNGGDEFLLLLRDVESTADSVRLTTHCLEALSAPFEIRGAQLHLTASAGICAYATDVIDAATLLARADEAMYQAKESGRNALRLYDAGLMQRAQERLQIADELRQALAAGQFELFYQPKSDIACEGIRSVEALLRWNHPVRGRLGPDAFLSIAEDAGLMQSVGSWAIDQACRQARAWQGFSLPGLRISVNVSATQFRHPEFVPTVQAALKRHGLHPSYLEIELRESALMADTGQSAVVLEQLSRLGVVIAVDDFGTGYSSMSCLQHFPIDKVKIDRSFIGHMQQNADDASVVRAIISLAHGLRLKVVAEGVESAEQLATLRRLGCDQYQGFYQSPAVPAADIERMIARR